MKCKCEPVVKLLNEEVNHTNYLNALILLNEFEEKGILELYAGDSYLDEVELHWKSEDRYTINHYYRCKKCQRLFYVGFCCRGGYVFRVEEYPYKLALENINFEHIMEGKEQLGVRFNNKQRYK